MQKKYSFDSITNNKILKGALIALTGGAAISLLTYLQGQDLGNVTINGVVALLVPTLVNAIREYMKGE